jgi:D-xylose 1-dehydrogenase (NADP+, D-xylono-1,5-lactone-forming)
VRVTSTDSPFRWGILGVARINRALLVPLNTGRNRLVAVASRTAARAEAYASEHGIPRTYGSYQALLDDDTVDAVYIPLPHAMHAEWAIRAAEAGKHVLCEKPVALTAADARAMQAAAETHGVVMTEAFMYRHHPLVALTAGLIREGALGRIVGVTGAFTYVLDRVTDSRLEQDLGGGSLWDVGCYPVSFARAVLGQTPVRVQAIAAWNGAGIDMSFFGQMHFADGVVAQITSSFEMPFRTEMEVIGTEGRLRIPRPFKPLEQEVLELRRGDEVEYLNVEGPPLYQGEVDDVADAARSGRAPLVTMQDSIENTETLVALLEAARTGRTIDVASSQ